MRARKAVIPMAGKGTRFRPITHVVPKMFLPIGNKPILHLIFDEIIAAGCDEAICIVQPGHDFVTPYVQTAEIPLKITLIEQTEALGLGHAVNCAAPVVGDEPFFVVLPDVLVDAAQSACAQLSAQWQGGGLIAVRAEPENALHQYGIINTGTQNGNIYEVLNTVEKPAPGTAPSNLAIIGRYLLPSTIFPILSDTQPGAGGEIQLTDALQVLASRSELQALVYEERGTFDTGTPAGWLEANNYYLRESLQS